METLIEIFSWGMVALPIILFAYAVLTEKK